MHREGEAEGDGEAMSHYERELEMNIDNEADTD
jgi:hypothetical protein